MDASWTDGPDVHCSKHGANHKSHLKWLAKRVAFMVVIDCPDLPKPTVFLTRSQGSNFTKLAEETLRDWFEKVRQSPNLATAV